MPTNPWISSLPKKVLYSLHQLTSNGASKEMYLVSQFSQPAISKATSSNQATQLSRGQLFSLGTNRRKPIRALSATSQQGRKEPCLRTIKTLCYSTQTLLSKKLLRSSKKVQLLRKIHPSRGPVQLARALESRSVREKSKINNSKQSKSMCRRPCCRTNLILRSKADPGSTVIKYDCICWIIWFDWFFTQSEKSAAMPSLLCTTNYTYQK